MWNSCTKLWMVLLGYSLTTNAHGQDQTLKFTLDPGHQVGLFPQVPALIEGPVNHLVLVKEQGVEVVEVTSVVLGDVVLKNDTLQLAYSEGVENEELTVKYRTNGAEGKRSFSYILIPEPYAMVNHVKNDSAIHMWEMLMPGKIDLVSGLDIDLRIDSFWVDFTTPKGSQSFKATSEMMTKEMKGGQRSSLPALIELNLGVFLTLLIRHCATEAARFSLLIEHRVVARTTSGELTVFFHQDLDRYSRDSQCQNSYCQ